MTDSVRSRLSEHFVRLMRNWALGTLGTSSGVAMTSAYTGQSGDGYDARLPTLRGEVTDVDVALQAVPILERKAVMGYWLYEGRSFVWLGKRLNCAHTTVVDRINRGHAKLQDELRVRRIMAVKYAERVREIQNN